MSRCFFCKFNTNPTIHEIENLDKFISPRKKILHREKTNVCAKHQRQSNKSHQTRTFSSTHSFRLLSRCKVIFFTL